MIDLKILGWDHRGLGWAQSPMMGHKEDEEQTWRHRREHFVETETVTKGIC